MPEDHLVVPRDPEHRSSQERGADGAWPRIVGADPARRRGGASPAARRRRPVSTPAAPAAVDTGPAWAGLSRRPHSRAAACGSLASAALALPGGRSGRDGAVARESRPNEATAAATSAPADTYQACWKTAWLAAPEARPRI